MDLNYIWKPLERVGFHAASKTYAKTFEITFVCMTCRNINQLRVSRLRSHLLEILIKDPFKLDLKLPFAIILFAFVFILGSGTLRFHAVLDRGKGLKMVKKLPKTKKEEGQNMQKR